MGPENIRNIKEIYTKYISKIKKLKKVDSIMKNKKELLIEIIDYLMDIDDNDSSILLLKNIRSLIDKEYWDSKYIKKFEEKAIYVKDLNSFAIRKLLANGFKLNDMISYW